MNRWDQFYGLMQEGDMSVLRRELGEMGVDVGRVERAVSAIAAMARDAPERAWIDRARRAQAEFDRSVRARTRWVSQRFGDSREMIGAITSGRLGPGVQKQARVFFRNGDLTWASEADLRSFLDDCELLGLIDGDKPTA